MPELTEQDREEIQNQIVAYQQEQTLVKKEEPILVPKAPDGQDANEALDKAIKEQATPGKHEERKIKQKIRGIWRKWRTTALDAKALEVEKIACQIAIERAETQHKLDRIRREEKVEKAEHWLKLNKGNLEDIDANTISRPSRFWYCLRRGFHHVTKLTNNVPKIIKNLFWIGVLAVVLVLLKHWNVL